jgi:hypothetical protein
MYFSTFQHSRNDPFNLAEIIQSLSRKQYEDMWCGLTEMCTQVLTSFDLEQQDNSGAEVFLCYCEYSEICHS